jgi:hypothetical protein
MIKHGCDKEATEGMKKGWCPCCFTQVVCDKCGTWAPKARWSCDAAEHKAKDAGFVIGSFGYAHAHLCGSCSKKTSALEFKEIAVQVRRCFV